VNISVKIWSPVSQWYSLYMRLLWEIKDILEQSNICIAFPQQVIHLQIKKCPGCEARAIIFLQNNLFFHFLFQFLESLRSFEFII